MPRAPLDLVTRKTTGPVRAGMRLYIYERGTANEVTGYTTENGSVEVTYPLVADSEGRFPNAWYPPDSYDAYSPDDFVEPTRPIELVRGAGIATRDYAEGLVSSFAAGPGGSSFSHLAIDATNGDSTIEVTTVPVPAGLVAIGAFTTDCEIRRMESAVGTTLTLDRALANDHASSSGVIFFDGSALSALWFGAVGDGAADDAPALNAALAAVPPSAEPGFTATRGFHIMLPSLKYRLGSTVEFVRSAVLEGLGPAGWDASAVLLPDPDVTAIKIHAYHGSGSDPQAQWSEISNLAIMAENRAGSGHGIHAKARFLLDGVWINKCGDDGIHAVSTDEGGPGDYAGNVNLVQLRGQTRVDECGRHGFFIEGGDANAGLIQGLDCSGNTEVGIYDSSFLGNTYIGCHTSANGERGYKTDGAANYSVFFGCYTESGQGPGGTLSNDLNVPTQVYGGTNMNDNDGNAVQTNIDVDGALRIYGALAVPTGPDRDAFISFGRDPENYGAMYLSRVGEYPYTLKHTGKGWAFVGITAGDGAMTLLTTSAGADLNGLANFPYGFVLGPVGSGTERIIGRGPIPSSGTYRRGDVVLYDTPSAGGYIGAVCVTAGSPGTWKDFGAIAA